jgi:hypothetical protein
MTQQVISEDFLLKYKDLPAPSYLPKEAVSKIETKKDGTQEQWYEFCQRVVQRYSNGVQKYHIENPESSPNWTLEQYVAIAEKKYDELFNLKWIPEWWAEKK